MVQEEPTNYQFAGAGLGISYIQDWVYALSGVKSVDDNETVLLQFTTGSGLIYADFGFWYATAVGGGDVGDDYQFRILFNNLLILTQNTDDVHTGFSPNYPKLIIPPLTSVIVSAQNSNDDTANDISATMTGRVYGAE